MKTPNLAALLVAISFVALAGCDAEAPPSADDTAAITDEGDDDGGRDDEDDDDDDSGPLAFVANVQQSSDGLHPCGDAVLDPGEQCDDGLANGDDRECTLACTYNDCDLDAGGWCEDHGPAADVDLYPCTDLGADPMGCMHGYTQS